MVEILKRLERKLDIIINRFLPPERVVDDVDL